MWGLYRIPTNKPVRRLPCFAIVGYSDYSCKKSCNVGACFLWILMTAQRQSVDLACAAQLVLHGVSQRVVSLAGLDPGQVRRREASLKDHGSFLYDSRDRDGMP